MIVDLLVTVFFGILNAVLGLIPTFSIFDPEEANAGIRGVDGALQTDGWATNIAAWLDLWNLFMPVSVMFTCIAAILAARLFVVIAQLLEWLWGIIPFKSA